MSKLKLVFLGLFPISLFAADGAFTFIRIATGDHAREHIYTFILMSLVLIALGLGYRATTGSKEEAVLAVPDKGISFRNLIETFGEGIYSLSKAMLGKDRVKDYFPFAAFLFLFIFLSNIIGLIPGFLPPTENFNTALALGLFSFAYFNLKGIKAQGIKDYVKHFMGPIWWLAPLIFIIEMVSITVRPISLALRLRGNMMGDHIVLGAFSDLVPWIVPIPFWCLGLFVCFMQAFVFTILSLVYVALATEIHAHDDHH